MSRLLGRPVGNTLPCSRISSTAITSEHHISSRWSATTAIAIRRWTRSSVGYCRLLLSATSVGNFCRRLLSEPATAVRSCPLLSAPVRSCRLLHPLSAHHQSSKLSLRCHQCDSVAVVRSILRRVLITCGTAGLLAFTLVFCLPGDLLVWHTPAATSGFIVPTDLNGQLNTGLN